MKDPINAKITIDTCGQVCPATLLIALREVNRHQQQLRNATIHLEILTDNPDSTNRVSEAVGNMGYTVQVEDRQNHYQILISKGDLDV